MWPYGSIKRSKDKYQIVADHQIKCCEVEQDEEHQEDNKLDDIINKLTIDTELNIRHRETSSWK